jgi:signal transduction histidine kinase
VAGALRGEVSQRANRAAAGVRLAANWGGASPSFLALLETGDPLFEAPFLTPVETVRARLEGVLGPEPALGAPIEERAGSAFGVPEGEAPRSPPVVTQGPADSTIVAVPAARSTEGELDDLVTFPAWFWRQVLAARSDTMFVLPEGALGGASPSWIVFPVIGFPQRVVAVAGWRINPQGLRHQQLHEIVENQVYRDQRVFRGEALQKSLAIVLYDPQGREVFRSREVGRSDLRVVRAVGGLLPGWRVAAAPSRTNAAVTSGAIIAGQYALLALLLALSLGALFLGLRFAMREVEVAELKGSFIANVSHELKTPLALIRMASETLELGRVRSPEEAQRFLATISRECRRLTHMINNVLDFSKIEEGKRAFVFAPTDLRRLVSDTLEIFEPQLKEGNFDVRVEAPPDLPPVELDAQAVTQCLINLVDNAIKYSRDRHELAVRISLNGDGGSGQGDGEGDGKGDGKGDGMVRVAISDRGMGVGPRDAERIFDKFTRAETGLVHNVKGSGLGLALVRHIARSHGGEVELRSTPGEGSTFTLVLPVKQNDRKEGNAWPPEF